MSFHPLYSPVWRVGAVPWMGIQDCQGLRAGTLLVPQETLWGSLSADALIGTEWMEGHLWFDAQHPQELKAPFSLQMLENCNQWRAGFYVHCSALEVREWILQGISCLRGGRDLRCDQDQPCLAGLPSTPHLQATSPSICPSPQTLGWAPSPCPPRAGAAPTSAPKPVGRIDYEEDTASV